MLPGFKYNFMDLQAALGIHQLASVDEFNARRIELAALYHELFAEVPEIGRPGIPAYDHFHTWHLYVVKVLDAAGISRDDFMAALRARNVGTGLHFRAVHTQPYYRSEVPGRRGQPAEGRVGLGPHLLAPPLPRHDGGRRPLRGGRRSRTCWRTPGTRRGLETKDRDRMRRSRTSRWWSPSTTRRRTCRSSSSGRRRRWSALGRPYEIVLVNDGSRDRSLALLREAAARDPHRWWWTSTATTASTPPSSPASRSAAARSWSPSTPTSRTRRRRSPSWSPRWRRGSTSWARSASSARTPCCAGWPRRSSTG